MANRIKGITIEIDGNTTKLTDALKKTNTELKSTQSDLKDVNKLLKLDPKNVELLSQKQNLLKNAVSLTTEKLAEEKKALEQLQQGEQSDKTIKQQEALKREIQATSLELKNYKTELKDTSVNMNTLAKVTGDLADKTKLISAGATTALVGIGGLAVKAGALADDLNTVAKQTGFTTSELQKMKYASDLIDVSYQDMTGSISRLTRQMASGNKAFEELGVSINDSNGDLRNANEVWYDTLYALSQVENETQRDAYAMDIFGKSANQLAGIIDDGGASLKAYGDEAERMGLILSQETLDSANQLNDAIDLTKARLEATFITTGAKVAQTFLPLIEEIAQKIANVLEWVASLDTETIKFTTTILAVVAIASPLLKVISGVISSIQIITTALGTLSTVSIPALTAASTAGVATISASFAGLLPVIAGVAVAISGIIALMQHFKQEKINAGWEEYGKSTSGMRQITATQAQNWMNSNEVQIIKNPSGTNSYYVKNSDYSWNKANASANGWRDDAVWGNNGSVNYNMNVSVEQINDLDDLLKIANQAQQMNRMGG